MKLDCAEFYSKEPTEEMIVDLVRNNAKRGEFMTLEADDGESFVQIAGMLIAVAVALAVLAGVCKFVLKVF